MISHILGILIGYSLFSQSNTMHNEALEINESETPMVTTQTSPQKVQTDRNPWQKKVELLRQQLKALKLTNADLKLKITAAEQANSKEELESQTSLQKVSMEKFTTDIQKTYIQGVRDVIIQLDDKVVESIKSDFEESAPATEASMNLQENLARFIEQNNNMGEHFITSLQCKKQICRLEVNTGNLQQWEQIYAQATHQPWFQAMTAQEKSDYADNIIYYIIQIPDKG